MILKSSRRAGSVEDARELLRHLLHGAGNEIVREIGLHGSIVRALDDARAVARDGRDAVWHLSVSPAAPLTEAQWSRAEEVMRNAYGLPDDLPITWVEHGKPHRPGVRGGLPPRPAHRHGLFPSWDPVTGRRISPWRHYVLNERVSRQLEHEFGHPPTQGRHNRHVASWCAANGMHGLATAMDMAGLLEGPPPRQRVGDAERRAGERRGRDPFASADVSATVLTSVEPSAPSPALAYIHGMRDGGFIVARGERGLVLVPADGIGKPVGAARKARLTESAMRALLGDEIDRLPEMSRTADLKTWLASHEASYGVRTLSGDDVKTEGPERVETNSLAGSGPGGHRDGHGASDNVEGGGQQGDVSGDVRDDSRGDGCGQPAATPSIAGAAGGRIPSSTDPRPADGRRGIPDQDRAPTCRARVEDGQAERILRNLDTGEIQRLTAVLRGTASSQVVHHGIALCPYQGSDESRRLRRRRWIASVLREAYDLAWIPESVASNIRRVDVDEVRTAVIVTLWSGTKLIDRHDRIDVVGEADDVAVKELVEVVRRRGWDAVELHGDEAFRRAAARALALVEPPIAVAGNPLDPVELDELADLVARRRPRAPSRLASSPPLADGATFSAYDRVLGGPLHGLG